MSTLGMSAIFFVLTIVGGIIMDCGAFYAGMALAVPSGILMFVMLYFTVNE